MHRNNNLTRSKPLSIANDEHNYTRSLFDYVPIQCLVQVQQGPQRRGLNLQNKMERKKILLSTNKIHH